MFAATKRLLGGSCGIIGVVGSGKSSLFTALTAITPTIGKQVSTASMPVYDERLHKLAAWASSAKIAEISINVSLAGNAVGDSPEYLTTTRHASVVLHVVRCFGSGLEAPNPLNEIAQVRNELILADLGLAEKRLARISRSTKNKDSSVVFTKQLVELLSNGRSANEHSVPGKPTPEDSDFLRQLLSAKPVLFVLNVDEESAQKGDEFSNAVAVKYGAANTVVMCCSLEAELSQFSERTELMELLKAYGIETPAVDKVSRKAMSLLGLQSFYTVGPTLAKAWSIPKGATALKAAGQIHSEFEQNFLHGRVLPWNQFVACTSLKDAERAMKIVPEGHVMQDGDCFIVEHSVSKQSR